MSFRIKMTHLWASLAAAAACLAIQSPAAAALKVGARAPDFTTTAVKGGKPYAYKLSDALRKGPVVLYFFPSAYTKGCTAEAHEFAEATDDFAKYGATVIGVTAGQVDKLAAFSKEHCRDKFPVAPASKTMIKGYDVAMPVVAMSNRTSYVIGRDGRIAAVYTDMNFQEHVDRSLAATKRLAGVK